MPFVGVGAVQGGLWAYESMADSEGAEKVSHIVSAGFLAAVSLCAAVGFVLYGGRLFLMLQRFPIESRGRKKKLREVGMVTSICAACFTIRWVACWQAVCGLLVGGSMLKSSCAARSRT